MSEITFVQRAEEPFPFDLLLLADPSEQLINHHLLKSDVFLAKEKNQILGVIVLKVIGSEAEIMNVAVDEKYQRKGIGTNLILYAIHYAKRLGCCKLLLGTADTSENQVKLYMKLGFSKSGLIKNYFIDHYSEPIIENGKQARNMIQMEMSLT